MSGLKKSFVLKLISVIVVNAFCVTQAGFAAPYNFGRNLRPVSRVEQAKRAADGKSAGAAGLEGELRLASSTGLTGAPAFVLLKVAKDITERVVDVISMPDSTSLSSNGIGIPIFSTDISLQGPAGFVVSGINFPDGTIKLFPEHIIFDDEKRSFYEKMLQKMANGKFLTPVEASIVSDIEKLKSEPPIELFSMIERQDAASYLALMAAMQKGYLCAHRSDALSMAPIRKPIHGFTEITHQTIFPIFDIVTKMTLENIFSEHSVVYMANDRDIQIKDDGTGTITFYRCVGGILQEDSPVVVSLTPREVDSIKKYFEEESSIQAAKETYKKKETQTPGNLRRWKEAEQNRTGLRRKTLADIARAHIGENIIFVNNLLDDYLGGIDALKRYFELTKGLLRLDQYERIFRNYHEQRPRLIELTRTLHSIIQEEEAAFMVEYKQRIKSQSELAAVRSSLDYLKDIAQTIEKEVLRNIEKALYLGNLDKADRAVLKDLPNSTIRELQSLVSVLNSIDKRMEIRGRDSLGLACEFTFATEQDYRAFLTSLPKDEKDSFDSRAVEEKTEYAKYPYNDLKNYTIKVKRGYNEKGEVDTTKPVVVTMVYKTAVLVGRLGDNVYQIINFIKEDPIIQRLLRDGESIKVIHARWASVGIISEENCHPVSNEGQYSVEINGDVGEYEAILDIPCSKMAKRYGRNGHIFAVLNGDIDNNDRYVLSGLRYYPNLQAAYIENLKRRISSKITTDTKAIPLRVEAYLARGYELEEAFRMAVSDFSGSYSIQMTSDLEPDKIFLALNGDGQGLYIGISQDGFHPASEIYGFIENTQRFLKVKPGQMLVIDRRLSPELTNLRRVIFERDGKPVSEPLTVEDDDIEETVLTSRDIDIRGFPHFFLKEVCETPDMLETTMEGRISVEHDSNGKRALIQLKEEELPPEIEDKIADGRIKEIRVIAMGTAEAACQVIAEKMRSSLKQTEKGRYISVAAEYATDTGFFTMKEDMSDTLVIAVSQSGTTKDTNSSLTEALKRGCSVIAIPNKRDTDLSFLSRDASGGVFYTGSGRDAEIAVASTKAYYAQICAGYILAMRFAQRLGIADEKLVSNIEEMYAIPAKMREFLQPFIPPLSHNFDTEEDYIQAMSEYKTKLEKHPLVRAANYWTLRKPNMEITGDGSNRAAAKEAQIKYQELTYSTVPHESGPEIIHENLSAEPLILLLAANTRGVGDRWLQDALSGVMKKWLAHNAAVVAVATQKELDTCDILKHGKNAYHNKALGTKEERPIDVIIVPETLEDFAPFFTVLAGHLYSYYAALSINDLAVRIGSATDKIISAWDKIRKGQEEGLEDIDIIGNQTFHRAAKVAFRDTRDYIFLRDLNMPGINAGVIIRYGALRDVLKGIIPFTVENIEDKFGKVMTATEIFEEFVRISEVLRLELTRTIDSIRHQAKTVTVGVESGREKEIEQVRHLVDGLQEHDNINQELIRASVEALGHYLKEGTYGVRAIDDTYQDGISYIITVGKDQPGMLYRITETIAEEGLNIHPEMNITSTSVFAESGEKVDAIIVPIEEGIETLREKKTAAIIQSRLETLSKPSMSDEKLRRVFSSRTSAPATGQAGAAGVSVAPAAVYAQAAAAGEMIEGLNYESVGVDGIKITAPVEITAPCRIRTNGITIDPTKGGQFPNGKIVINKGTFILDDAQIRGPGVIDRAAKVGGYVDGSPEKPFVIGPEAIVLGDNVGESIIGPKCVVKGARLRGAVVTPFYSGNAFVPSGIGTGSVIEDIEEKEDGTKENRVIAVTGAKIGTNVRIRRFCDIGPNAAILNSGEVKSSTLTGASENASVDFPHLGYLGSVQADSIVANTPEEYKTSLLAVLTGAIINDEPLEKGHISSSGLLRKLTIQMPDGEIVSVKAQRINFGASTITSDYDPLTGQKTGAIVDGGSFTGVNGVLKSPVWIGNRSGVGNLSQSELDEAVSEGTIVVGISKGPKAVIESYRAQGKDFHLGGDLERAVDIQMEYFRRLGILAEVYGKAARYAKNPYELAGYLAKLESIKGQFDEIGLRYGRIFGKPLHASIEALHNDLVNEPNEQRQHRLSDRIYDQEKVRARQKQLVSELDSIKDDIDTQHRIISQAVTYASIAEYVKQEALNPTSFASWLNPLAAASAVGVDLDDIKGRIIGTDGLRGKVMSDEEVEVFLETLRQKGELGQDETVDDIDLLLKYGILTDRLAYYHGQAYAMTFETSIPFMAGGDNRPSTKKIIENLSEGIRSQGGNVALLEPIITTPALGFLSSHKKYNNIGVVISGSHLLAEENGIKGLLNGRKLLEEDTLKLERNTYLIAKDIVKLPDKTSTGRKEVIDDAEQAYGEYIKYVVDRIQDEFGEKPFAGKTVVLDLANGAATNFAPIIFYELGARVFTINGSFIDGRLINLQDNGATDEEGKTLTSGALNTSRLREEVLRLKADIGVGFDGDADRALFSDEKGKEVDGDGSLGAIALCLKERGALTHNGVVITTMATLGLRKTLERAEINTVLTKVGDRHVSDKMDSNGYVAGGEQSGHTIFRDYQTAGDGVVTACVLLGNAVRKGVGVSELTDQISKTEPYLKKNISAPSPDIANRLIKELNENNRGQNGFYDAIIKIVEEGFISNGMAARYTVSKSNEGYVAANELYIQLWDADNNIKAWISFRQSGTEPKNIRIFLNVDADKETAEQVHRQLIQLTEREIQDISMQPDATAAAGGAATIGVGRNIEYTPGETLQELLDFVSEHCQKMLGYATIKVSSDGTIQGMRPGWLPDRLGTLQRGGIVSSMQDAGWKWMHISLELLNNPKYHSDLDSIFLALPAKAIELQEKRTVLQGAVLLWPSLSENGKITAAVIGPAQTAAGASGKATSNWALTSKEIGERLSKATRELEIAQERLLIVKPTGNKENIAAAQRHLDRWDARVRELKIELDISLGVARNRPNRDDFGEWTAPAAGTTVTLPEAALIIGPDGLQRIEAIAALVPSYGRDNIFEADSEAAATGMLDGIRKTHSIALVVNATGNALTAALASGIGPAKVINLSPDENAETALEDV